MKFDLKSLSLDEKLRLLCGRDPWQLYTADGKLPNVFVTDGPHGLRMKDYAYEKYTPKKATAMPNFCVLACTWDAELAFLDGATIADECLEKGTDVLLAPGVNIRRTPLCGRNFEYFSEDPLLSGVLGKAFIEGVQSKGVGTSLKHFCANNREYDRLYQSSEVDERTLREMYLPAFEIAVQAKPWTVMCAYNAVNGVWASENEWLLRDILRDEFGFDGVIVSDWGAVHNSYRAAKATLDLEMPYSSKSYPVLKEAYEKGLITEAEIDARAEKVLALIEKCATQKKPITTDKAQRHENALKIAREGIVLLKNEDGILPIKGGNVVVAGSHTESGGGSAFVTSDYEARPLKEELAARLGDKGTVIGTKTQLGVDRFVQNARDTYAAASKADYVVITVGTGTVNEQEARDRDSLRLSCTQEDFILGNARFNKNVVVVLQAGSAVDMTPWIDKVKAVVLAGFAGEASKEAIADILTGKVCPSGKLTETFPLRLEDTPTGETRGDGFVERYPEGVFVGYRWYDTYDKEVLFPFGYGLSYAKYEYSDLEVKKLGETDFEVSYNVTNVSDVDGKEISQVYVHDVFASVSRPQKELRGFAKTALKAGESKRVCVKLDFRSFAFYSVPLKRWYVENGEFDVLVGASSRDIRLSARIEIALPETEQYSF